MRLHRPYFNVTLYFYVPTVPPCACDMCQVEVWCYVNTEVQTDIKQAERDCQLQGASMVTVISTKEMPQLLQMAADAGDDLWVLPSSMRIQAAGAFR